MFVWYVFSPFAQDISFCPSIPGKFTNHTFCWPMLHPVPTNVKVLGDIYYMYWSCAGFYLFIFCKLTVLTYCFLIRPVDSEQAATRRGWFVSTSVQSYILNVGSVPRSALSMSNNHFSQEIPASLMTVALNCKSFNLVTEFKKLRLHHIVISCLHSVRYTSLCVEIPELQIQHQCKKNVSHPYETYRKAALINTLNT